MINYTQYTLIDEYRNESCAIISDNHILSFGISSLIVILVMSISFMLCFKSKFI